MKFGQDLETDYALRFAGLLVGHRLTTHEVSDKTCRRIFEALSRTEELTRTVRDQWGGWDWQYSDAQRRGELYVPWLDESLVGLRMEIQDQHPDWSWEPLWPEKKRFALCLTHDVDDVITEAAWGSLIHTVQHDFQSNLSPRIRAGRAKGLVREWLNQLCARARRPLRNFDEWLKLESSFGFSSTFYFFPSRLWRRDVHDCSYQFHDIVHHGTRTMTVGEMIRNLDMEGWEIGLHGSYQSAVESGLLIDERRQLEEVVGRPIISTRQHWLHYDVRTTPRLQTEAGFSVDSTQGFNRSIGFRAGTAFPYWCWDHQAGQSLPVLEVPQHIMDGGLFSTHALEYDADLAIEHSLQLMNAVERVGGCLTLSWHPYNVNDDKCWTVYKTLLEEAARRQAWGCSAGDLYRWWTAREQRVNNHESVQSGSFRLETGEACHSSPRSLSS